jgi:integrase
MKDIGAMKYITKRGNYYHYVRRVPLEIKEIDGREMIQISLKTDSRQVAERRAVLLEQQINAYWREIMLNPEGKEDKFKRAVKYARLQGYSYLSAHDIAQGSIQEAVERIFAADKVKDAPEMAGAILGAVKQPELSLSAALERFWAFSKDQLLDKSESQVRKWKNPRIKAVGNFITVAGDKNITDITRDDILNFKDWWINRIMESSVIASTANKDFIHLRGILYTVCQNMRLDLNVADLFDRVTIRENAKATRASFEPSFVQNVLLNKSGKMAGINPEFWHFICAMADTGARINELVGLEANNGDIRLDTDIPFIHIRANKTRQLKTPQSDRVIPLVGSSLFAFTQRPEGFVSYHDRADSLSNAINKWFRDNEVLPSLEHSLYSLRHCFQDRLIAVEAPDRVQAELMGHKFHRPKYGTGASLEQKKSWLGKIAFKI